MADSEDDNGTKHMSNQVYLALLLIALSLGMAVGFRSLSNSSSTSTSTSLSGNQVPATAQSAVTEAAKTDGTSLVGAAASADAITPTKDAEGSPSEPVSLDADDTWPATGSWVSVKLDVLTLRVADSDTYRCSLTSPSGTTFVQATMGEDTAQSVREAMAAAGDGLGTVTLVGRVAGTTSQGTATQHVIAGCTVASS